MTAKLLLVDDEDMLRVVLAEFLTEEGFQVVQAPNCGTALWQLERNPDVGCVLSDVRMPDGNGFELAANILKARPSAKIALMTGFSDVMPEHLARKGVHMFMKPLPLAE